MLTILNSLIVTPDKEEPTSWKLVKELKLSDPKLNVPEGFVTDLASIPRALWTIFPPMGRYSQAAVVHDYLCVSQIVPRKEADQIFLDLMEYCGVPLYKRKIFYYAVRANSNVFHRGK